MAEGVAAPLVDESCSDGVGSSFAFIVARLRRAGLSTFCVCTVSLGCSDPANTSTSPNALLAMLLRLSPSPSIPKRLSSVLAVTLLLVLLVLPSLSVLLSSPPTSCTVFSTAILTDARPLYACIYEGAMVYTSSSSLDRPCLFAVEGISSALPVTLLLTSMGSRRVDGRRKNGTYREAIMVSNNGPMKGSRLCRVDRIELRLETEWDLHRDLLTPRLTSDDCSGMPGPPRFEVHSRNRA